MGQGFGALRLRGGGGARTPLGLGGQLNSPWTLSARVCGLLIVDTLNLDRQGGA